MKINKHWSLNYVTKLRKTLLAINPENLGLLQWYFVKIPSGLGENFDLYQVLFVVSKNFEKIWENQWFFAKKWTFKKVRSSPPTDSKILRGKLLSVLIKFWDFQDGIFPYFWYFGIWSFGVSNLILFARFLEIDPKKELLVNFFDFFIQIMKNLFNANLKRSLILCNILFWVKYEPKIKTTFLI